MIPSCITTFITTFLNLYMIPSLSPPFDCGADELHGVEISSARYFGYQLPRSSLNDQKDL